MANSKRKSILNYLKATTLPAITVAGGYSQDIKTVERGIRPLDALADSNLPALFVGKTLEKRQNITRNQFQSLLTVFIVGFCGGSATATPQEALDDLIGDTTKALETDRTLGGNAKALEIKDITTDDGNLAPRAGFVMEVELMYATEGIIP
jgi:hypothetical protein